MQPLKTEDISEAIEEGFTRCGPSYAFENAVKAINWYITKADLTNIFAAFDLYEIGYADDDVYIRNEKNEDPNQMPFKVEDIISVEYAKKSGNDGYVFNTNEGKWSILFFKNNTEIKYLDERKPTEYADALMKMIDKYEDAGYGDLRYKSYDVDIVDDNNLHVYYQAQDAYPEMIKRFIKKMKNFAGIPSNVKINLEAEDREGHYKKYII